MSKYVWPLFIVAQILSPLTLASDDCDRTNTTPGPKLLLSDFTQRPMRMPSLLAAISLVALSEEMYLRVRKSSV